MVIWGPDQPQRTTKGVNCLLLRLLRLHSCLKKGKKPLKQSCCSQFLRTTTTTTSAITCGGSGWMDVTAVCNSSLQSWVAHTDPTADCSQRRGRTYLCGHLQRRQTVITLNLWLFELFGFSPSTSFSLSFPLSLRVLRRLVQATHSLFLVQRMSWRGLEWTPWLNPSAHHPHYLVHIWDGDTRTSSISSSVPPQMQTSSPPIRGHSG